MATTARTGAARTLGAMAAGAFPTQAYGRAVGCYLGLPGTFEGAVRVEQDLRIPMEDGVVLLADRYVPRAAGARPTVLVRSPYGRRGFYGFLYGLLYGAILRNGRLRTRGSGGCSRWRPRPGSAPQTKRSSTIRSTPRHSCCPSSALRRDRRAGARHPDALSSSGARNGVLRAW